MSGVAGLAACVWCGVMGVEGAVPPGDVAARLDALARDVQGLREVVVPEAGSVSRMALFHGYIGVFVCAFLVALLTTPLMRRLALANGVIDRPNETRKIHRMPIAYLGGAAVFLGMMAGILFGMTHEFHHLMSVHESEQVLSGSVAGAVPLSILLGMTVITVTGLIDDVSHISPRVKVGGQLIAAAALAMQDVGTNLARGVINPIGKSLGLPMLLVSDGAQTVEHLGFVVQGMGVTVPVDIVYWSGTALIALFVLGACNASNLIDGLDGLLAGTTAISAIGLLIVALGMAAADDGPLDAARVVMCLALLGGCLGFLPHNFNPATIFLGDAGSLLLGYSTIVIILTLGDTGKTHLVLAGLMIYALPIIDTTLAIVRRKVTGKKISDPDDQHLHHMLKRELGVKGAVIVLYGIAGSFASLGVALSLGRGRITYVLALVFAAYIGVTAYKVARRAHHEAQSSALGKQPERSGGAGGAGAAAGEGRS